MKPYKRYVEPFAGSACVFFDIEPGRALLSDLNSDLIDTYRAIRRSPELVLGELAAMRRSKKVYLKLRSLAPKTLSREGAAARFLYLNRYCFNGLFRTNLKGQFNVPYSGERTGGLPSPKKLMRASRLLSRAKMLAGDFEAVLTETGHGDFVYLDPPYSLSKRRTFVEYGPRPFDGNDLVRLRSAISGAIDRGATVLLSYQDIDTVRDMFLGLHQKRLSVRRTVAGFAGSRKGAYERLIGNAPIPLEPWGQ
jgi:DNA adenine methylase